MLRDLMKVRDINGAQLGRRLGVSRAVVSRWVVGKSVPKTVYLAGLSEALGVSVEEIIANVNEKHDSGRV